MKWRTLTALSFLVALMAISFVPVFAFNSYVLYERCKFGNITFLQESLPLTFSEIYKDYNALDGVRWHFNETWIYTTVAINVTGFSSNEWLNYTTSAGTQKIYLGVEPDAVYFDDVLNTADWSYSAGIVTLTPSGTDIDISYSEGAPVSPPVTLPDFSQYSYSYLYGAQIQLYIAENCSMTFANYDAGINIEVTEGNLNGTAIIQYLNNKGTVRLTSYENATYTVTSYLDGTPHVEGGHNTYSTTSEIQGYTITGDSLLFWWGRLVEPALPYMFILGIIGVFSFFGGAIYGAKLLKEGDYENAIIQGTIFMSLGFGLILAWLLT